MIVTVSELNSYVKEFFDANPIFTNIFVKGEISNFKHHTSGHCYFSLKDEKSVIKAVMFKYSAINLNFLPENGMKVIVNARLSSYERDGVYQLYVNEMQPDGIGALHIKYEQLKEKLSEEGLFDNRFKKSIPRFPKNVGIVTSKTGAAIRDIINVIKRRAKSTNIIIYPATVQGRDAYKTIVNGIEYFNNNRVDVIIIGRGGGSIEDLWCFNEEAVARAIFNSTIPIISAVGHETDYTISDFVADLRAPTPSAAAELCVPSLEDTKEYINISESRLKNALINNLKINQNKLNNCLNSNIFKYPERIYETHSQDVISLLNELCVAFNNNILKHKEIFIKYVSKLDSISPLKVLSRGYTFVENIYGDVIDSVNKLKCNDMLSLKFSDGSAQCQVVNKIKEIDISVSKEVE